MRMAVIGACALAALIALPAFADIKSFNSAVAARDFQKAAAEAASTWPTLNKSREDIALIAREFGFVSYVAKDYAAAKMFAEFGVTQSAAGPDADEARTLASVLLKAAEYRLKPSDAARDALFAALDARRSLPNFDNISFAATEALVAHDVEKGRWRPAMASTELAARLASAGGPAFTQEKLKYDLYRNIAEYRVSRKAEVHDRLGELRDAVWSEAAATPNDASAQRFVKLFWEVSAWRATLSAHLKSRNVGEFIRSEDERMVREKEVWATKFNQNERLARLMGRDFREEDEVCRRKFVERTKPDFPASALHAGFVGSVILRADVAEDGELYNPDILAAVPEKYFGDAVLKKIGDMRYAPEKDWDPAVCTMARPGAIITFEFVIGGR